MRAAWVICLFVAACGGDSAGDEFKCEDPKYGNGTCDLDTTCNAPDIDCFVTFASPDEAKTWYDGQTAVVTAKGTSLAPTDPRFASTQALLDEGWELYKTLHEVGDLAPAQPRLVLIDNNAVNAFVLSDTDRTRAGLAVMVNTGLIDRNAPKEQLLGIMMHEFEHAAGLHVNATVKARFLHYYKAGASDEPLGFQQADDPVIRAKFEAWGKYAQFSGYASDPELSGLPFTSNNPAPVAERYGVFGAFFFKLITERRTMVNTVACNDAVTSFTTIHNLISTTSDPVTDAYTVTTAQTTTIVNAITAVRDQCFAGVTGDAIVHLARVAAIPEAALRAELPAELATEINGKTVITGWFNAIRVARERMRALETELMTSTGVPWSRLRYFSTEEAADDSSARLMHALGLPPDGAGRLLISVDPELATACTPLLAGPGLIPYGENVTDDHHGTCWRVRHQQQAGPTMEARKLPFRRLGPPRAVTVFTLMPQQP